LAGFDHPHAHAPCRDVAAHTLHRAVLTAREPVVHMSAIATSSADVGDGVQPLAIAHQFSESRKRSELTNNVRAGPRPPCASRARAQMRKKSQTDRLTGIHSVEYIRWRLEGIHSSSTGPRRSLHRVLTGEHGQGCRERAAEVRERAS